jgi:radical SAM superfamily enzyme YgiQ (UPF0313 family)
LIDVGTARNELNEPLAIEILSANLKHFFPTAKIDVAYLQLTEQQKTNQELCGYDIIGISTKINSIETIEGFLSRMTEKSFDTRPLFVLGGLVATFAYKQLLLKYPNAICVLGEGEDAIVGIAKTVCDNPNDDIAKIKKALHVRQIPNIALNMDGQIRISNRKLVCLEELPKPSREFLSTVIKQRGLVRLEGSRGCSWGGCTFCGITAKYGCAKWRPFPVRHIIEQLEEISSAGGRYPYFTDEDFIGNNPKRAIEIADAIIDAKTKGRIAHDLAFYVNLPAKSVTKNRIALMKLKKAGLKEVFVGIESGSKTQLTRYGKNATVKDNAEALHTLRDLGLKIDIGFMMFDSEVTVTEVKENIDFLGKLGLIEHGERYIKRVRIEPETELASRLLDEKLIDKFDIDTLSYPYNFKDPLIQLIADEYEDWEKPFKDKLYLLQALTRGEAFKSIDQKYCTKLLGEFRRLDVEYLKALILKSELGSEIIKVDLQGITCKRDALLVKLDSLLFSVHNLTIEPLTC